MKEILDRKKEILIVFFLFFLAFSVRIYQIESITPGMYGDEVTVAIKALDLLHQSEWPPFIGDYSHPTPLLYITAASIHSFGNAMTSIRMPSIVFGSLTIVALYFFLRFFFPLKIAFLGGLLMTFQYSHIVLSRLAYEPASSLFFQMIVLIFLYLFYKAKDTRFLIAIALAMGIGFYTYLSFRVFAAVVSLIVFVIIAKQTSTRRVRNICLYFCILFVAIMPLASYAIIDTQGFFGRTSEISLFSQGYTQGELLQELWGNTYRTVVLPFVGIPGSDPPRIGDPNPGKNPSGVAMFDPITTSLAVIGIVSLFRKKRKYFYVAFVLLLAAFMSDIFSTEIIPGVHYYGLGHPNTLRVSGIILVVIFLATVGFSEIFNRSRAKNGILISVTLFICVLNWHWYFNQESISRRFYLYNYKVNMAETITMAKYLNTQPAVKISLSSDIAKNKEYLQFFLKKEKQVNSFELQSVEKVLDVIHKSDATAIAINEKSVQIVNSLLARGELENDGYVFYEVKGIVDQPDIIIFHKSDLYGK